MTHWLYEKSTLIGRITRIHGYEGSVIIRLERNFIENIPGMEWVFLEIDGRLVPFFIFSNDYTGGDTIRLKFEGYQLSEKVTEFVGCKVFLTAYEEPEKPESNIEDIKGYSVLLKDRKVLGIIDEIIQRPGQDLLRILTSDNKEILIPLHEDFITALNRKNKTIVMDFPEGLLQINPPL